MVNLAAIKQLLLAMVLLLQGAVASGNQTQMQQALLTAQQTVSIVQESGVLNPVTPVYYTNESETQLQTSTSSVAPSPILGAAQSTTPEIWTCSHYGGGYIWRNQYGVASTTPFTAPTPAAARNAAEQGISPCSL